MGRWGIWCDVDTEATVIRVRCSSSSSSFVNITFAKWIPILVFLLAFGLHKRHLCVLWMFAATTWNERNWHGERNILGAYDKETLFIGKFCLYHEHSWPHVSLEIHWVKIQFKIFYPSLMHKSHGLSSSNIWSLFFLVPNKRSWLVGAGIINSAFENLWHIFLGLENVLNPVEGLK